MEAIFLVGAAQALFFAVLVFTKQEKSVADIFLTLWLVTLSFALILPFFIFNNEIYRYIHLSDLEVGLLTSQPVWLYLYVYLLTSKKAPFNLKLLLHFIPVLLVILLFIPYYELSGQEKIELYEGTVEFPKIILAGGIASISLIFIYVVLSLLKIRKHKRNLKYMFSFQESINLHWLQNLVVSFVVIFIIESILFGFFLFNDSIKVYYLDYSGYLLFAAFVFVLGYFGYKQGEIFQHKKVITVTDKIQRKQKSSSTKTSSIDAENAQLAEQLNTFVSEQKPWLNTTLTLYDLASELNISSHQLTALLNNFLKTNFYDYINHYRVEEVKKMLKNNIKKYTILAIALECGFNNKASFNRIFKQKTGQTPSEFIKKNMSQ
ncbi:MAG: helix-turn-helix domain-containing protein [Bacteroidales bacterium]|nr:helix-turn-helix domain-containing protein [Bacteroidales bacterium]